jgi:hypothetical protein
MKDASSDWSPVDADFTFVYAEDSRGHMDVNSVHETLTRAPGRLEKERGLILAPCKQLSSLRRRGTPIEKIKKVL